MKPVRTVAWRVVRTKKVHNMQRANRMCESIQARRRVSHGIWKRLRRRVRRAWRPAEGEGAGGKKDVMDAERMPGVPGVWWWPEEGVLTVGSGVR